MSICNVKDVAHSDVHFNVFQLIVLVFQPTDALVWVSFTNSRLPSLATNVS